VAKDVAEASTTPLGQAAVDALAAKAGVSAQLVQVALTVAQGLTGVDGGGVDKGAAADKGVSAASEQSKANGTGAFTEAQSAALKEGIASML
jgi:hypothetical protein